MVRDTNDDSLAHRANSNVFSDGTQNTYWSVSRRDVLARSLGVAAGALSAWTLAGGVAKAEDGTPNGSNIDLLEAVRFQGINRRDKGAAFSENGDLLAAFGNNLLDYKLSTRTSRLFRDGDLAVVGVDDLQEVGDLDRISRVEIGNKLIHTQIISATDGGTNFSVASVEPTNDLDILGNPTKVFSGNTFRVFIQSGTQTEKTRYPTMEIETIYNIPADSFPEGIRVSGQIPPFRSDLSELLGIGAETVSETLGFDELPPSTFLQAPAVTRRCVLVSVVTVVAGLVCVGSLIVTKGRAGVGCKQTATLLTTTRRV